MALPRQLVAATLIVTLMSQVTGCTLRRSTPMQPTPEAFSSQHPDAVRVTRADGSRIPLYRPELVGDTLRGLNRPPATFWTPGLWRLFLPTPERVRVPLGDIRAIEDRSTNVPLTIVVNGAIALAGGLVLVAVWHPCFGWCPR